jgi:hypothetical protein
VALVDKSTATDSRLPFIFLKPEVADNTLHILEEKDSAMRN